MQALMTTAGRTRRWFIVDASAVLVGRWLSPSGIQSATSAAVLPPSTDIQLERILRGARYRTPDEELGGYRGPQAIIAQVAGDCHTKHVVWPLATRMSQRSSARLETVRIVKSGQPGQSHSERSGLPREQADRDPDRRRLTLSTPRRMIAC